MSKPTPPYKFCRTYRRQCHKARNNGMCRNKDKERCVEDARYDKLIEKGHFNYGNTY